MTSTPQTEALEAWLRSNGAVIQPHVRILEAATAGVHIRATEALLPRTTIATAPHSISLSYLNAIVDDAYPVYSTQRRRMRVEAIGFFYLMTQYLNQDKSFWKPYLDSLPSPDADLAQPLFFEETEDIEWLAETDVWHTVLKREKKYEDFFHGGIMVLGDACIDTQPYTWHLFKWAVAMYTSRSFSSRCLRPRSGNHWTAYRSSSDGSTRDAVSLDMSEATADDLHFPVLFPGLDAANHSSNAKVEWTFNPDRFSISLAGQEETDGITAGSEFFNNYGAKSNGELMIGYGFCQPDNPHDTVGMTLKPPPSVLQEKIRALHPRLFAESGEWDSDKATFYLKKPKISPQTTSGLAHRPQIFNQLPEPLLELLLYILRHEGNLPFRAHPQALRFLTDLDSDGRRYLPHIARMIVASLGPKLQKLISSQPSRKPRNQKQGYASIYREGQVGIMEALIAALKDFTRALIHRPPQPRIQLGVVMDVPNGPTLLPFPAFISLLVSHALVDADQFLQGIAHSAGTSDLLVLREAGWEEDLWVLLISFLYLSPLPTCLEDAFGEYVTHSHIPEAAASQVEDLAEAATDVMDVVRAAATAFPDSLWASERWTPGFVARTGGAVVRHESFMVMVPSNMTGYDDGDETGEQERAGLFIYFHFPTR